MERYVPNGKHDYIDIEHKQRYSFAMPFIQGKAVLDAACGEGYGSKMMSKVASSVVGIDLSEETIIKATQKYVSPNLSFETGDISKLDFEDDSFDVVVSFETIEHVPEHIQWAFIREVRRVLRSDGVLIISTPNKKISEQRKIVNEYHIKEFYKHEFCELLENEFSYVDLYKQYYGDGLFLHKLDENEIPLILNRTRNEFAKEDYFIAVASQAIINTKGSAPIYLSDRDFHEEIVTLFEAYKNREAELTAAQKQSTHLSNELTAAQSQSTHLSTELTAAQKQSTHLSNELKKQITYLSDELEKQSTHLSDELTATQNLLNKTQQEKEQAQRTIIEVQNITNSMMKTRLFRVIHLWARFKYQLLLGSLSEKKGFFQWLSNRKKKIPTRGKSYNPLLRITDAIGAMSIESLNLSKEPVLSTTIKENVLKHNVLNQDYKNFDVIILSVIDYDFRYQRPQHFADMFAKNGHRVFYFNANHHRDAAVIRQAENLNVININNPNATAIHVTDWSNQLNELKSAFDVVMNQFAIRDAIVVVDYPNWVLGAKYLRQKYGFKIVTDYMDDFMGFINPAEDLVRQNCMRLLKESNLVIASSQFLYDIAVKHNKWVEIVRNGTEYEFFAQAYTSEKKEVSKRKVIGYYGAISHWFAHDMVCYAAKNLPDCDFVLIGEVTAHEKELTKMPNIKLLGEKPYSTLPNYLRDFDVCLIPFDTSTDLIKATNPVKFYEYLSAGKKIVATEIPELEPFKNKYVLMSNDKDIFLEQIKCCLSGTDVLESPDGLMRFAYENSWGERFNSFAEYIESAVPKVSVIVLTFNNLKLNKLCISSILEKTAYPNFELIVVDNCSTDGTVEYLRELDECGLPNVKVIFNKENLGFAGGNNVGIKESNSDYVILLNNDTIVTRGWMTALVKHLENDNEMGMSGSVTNSIGNEAKIRAHYSNISEMHYFAEEYTRTHMGEIFYKQPNALAMFAICIKREVIEKCGYIDEAYAVGMFEDDDYSRAVNEAGYKLCIAEDSFVHHFDGSTFKKLDDEKYRKIFEENMTKFNKKWNTKWQGHKYRDGVGVDRATIEVQEA